MISSMNSYELGNPHAPASPPASFPSVGGDGSDANSGPLNSPYHYASPTTSLDHASGIPSPAGATKNVHDDVRIEPAKRARDDGADATALSPGSNHADGAPALPLPSCALPSSQQKRSRENKYVPPRKIPQTFTSVMGTLAVTSSSSASSSSGLVWGATRAGKRVSLRRQLSGSNMEAFIGGDHDAMDVDNSETRPRSMSF